MVYFSLNVRCVTDVALSGGDGGGRAPPPAYVDGESTFTATGFFSVMVIRRFILFRVDKPCVESISLMDPERDGRPCNKTFFWRLLRIPADEKVPSPTGLNGHAELHVQNAIARSCDN